MSDLFDDEAATVPLGAQIRVVEREIRMRMRVYTDRVERGSMSQHEADNQLRGMRAVLRTLESLEEQS